MFTCKLRKASFIGAFFLISGCATYQSKVFEARSLLSEGRSTEAIDKLKPLADEDSGDRLVYLLDYGMALSLAGRLDEANRALIEADRLAESLDYLSVSRFAGSLALSEEMVQYKGDTFEKIFINAQLALNFIQQGNLDSALVEARRLNEKLQRYRVNQEVQEYRKSDLGTYLSALLWEASGQYDDAYIAFENTYKINPSYPGIGEDLIRSAKLARRPDAHKKWLKEFTWVKEDPRWYDRKQGSLIVLVQQGWGPRKVISRQDYRFPDLRPVRSLTERVDLLINQQERHSSQVSYDVEAAAIATLAEDRGALLAKRVAGIVTKEVLADQIRQKDETLGALAALFMHASDRADLRQWSTLPQTLQIIRVPLKPGKYSFKLEGKSFAGEPTGEELSLPDQEVKAGKTKFLVWRTLK